MAHQPYDQLQQHDKDDAESTSTCVVCKKHARRERLIDAMILLNVGLFLLAVVAVSFLLGISSTGRFLLSRNADPSLPDAVYCEFIFISSGVGVGI